MHFLLLLCLPFWAWGESFTGKVVNVSDGDTVTVLREGNLQERVRLTGIDAPEKEQDFGQRAKEALSDLVAGEVVTVEFQKRDFYGRIVGKIFLQKKDVSLEQVTRGLAWHYRQYAREQAPEDAAAYATAQVEAQREEIGLWSMPDAKPPWEFRRERKRPATEKRKAARAAAY